MGKLKVIAADKEQAAAAFELAKQNFDACLHYSTLRSQLTLSNVGVTGVALGVAIRFHDSIDPRSAMLFFLGMSVFFSYLVFKIGKSHTLHWRKHEIYRKTFERFYGLKEPIHERLVTEFNQKKFFGRSNENAWSPKLYRMWQIANAVVPLLAILPLSSF